LTTRKRLLFHSNAPWVGTGYGMQCGLFTPEIARLGYDVAISAFYGLSGAMQDWEARDGNKYRVYPGGQNTWGNDVFGAHCGHWFGREKGAMLVLTDPWVLVPNLVARVPCIAWTPIDHDPLIPQTKGWYRESRAVPVAMSRFGQQVLEDGGVEDPLYLPHGYDPSVYYPRPRDEAREAAQIPKSVFVVGMVAANKGTPSRKGFMQALAAFSAFRKRHDDVALYLHTQVRAGDGENITKMAETLGIKPYIPHQYLYSCGFLLPSHVANCMSSFDVLLNASHGEGFGIPILEAGACGTPAVVTNFSAMPEVAGPTAWVVGGQPIWTGFDSWQLCPDIEEIVEALEEAYSEPEKERAARRQKTHDHATQFQVSAVADEYLAPVLAEAVHRLDWKETQDSVRELV
jgi:glycosyltransferase involved in cell wall biosynthesis